MAKPADLDDTIRALLADPQWQGHPLYQALDGLYCLYCDHTEQLERMTRISDRYQKAEHDRGMSYAARHEQQMKRLERLLRISDRYQQSLQQLNEELRQQSEQDELTGLYNRRYMQARLRDELARQQRGGRPFCVVLGDVDHFKRINDAAGHEAGDLVLQRVADLLLSRLRQTDCCARWGGEEFLLLLPVTKAAEADVLVRDIMQKMAGMHITGMPDGTVLSMSFGIAQSDSSAVSNVESLIALADAAMYAAKNAGRNQLSHAD